MKGGTRVECQEKIDILRQGIAGRHLCMLDTMLEETPEYIYPLMVSDRFVLYQQEDNFLLDGYAVRRLAQVHTVRLRSGKYEKINRLHGVADGICTPPVDISTWQTLFSSLQKLDTYVTIEDEKNGSFAIGEIRNVYARRVDFLDFDADGVWQNDLWEIPYSTITKVTWGDRYSLNWQRYLRTEA